jgi:hypothetical protein
MYPLTGARNSVHPATFCFSVHADDDVSVMPKVCGILAKRSLTPERLIATRFSHGAGELHVDFQINGVDHQTAEHLAQEMRRMVCARVVLISQK